MAERYNHLEYDSEEERRLDPDGPLQRNQIAAAEFLASILRPAHISYAIMGGFALVLRGSTRPTRDIDIVVDSAPLGIWSIIETQKRLIIPASRLIDGVIKVFIKTGPGHDACSNSYNVEADLVIKGAKGSPRNVNGEREPLEFRDPSRQQQIVFQALNIRYMMRTKLRAVSDRGLPRDFSDVAFLLQNFPEKVREIARDLDHDEVNCFLQGNIGSSKVPQYRAILGI